MASLDELLAAFNKTAQAQADAYTTHDEDLKGRVISVTAITRPSETVDPTTLQVVPGPSVVRWVRVNVTRTNGQSFAFILTPERLAAALPPMLAAFDMTSERVIRSISAGCRGAEISGLIHFRKAGEIYGQWTKTADGRRVQTGKVSADNSERVDDVVITPTDEGLKFIDHVFDRLF